MAIRNLKKLNFPNFGELACPAICHSLRVGFLLTLVILGCQRDTPPPPAPVEPQPARAVASQTTRGIGEIDLGKEYTCAFTIKNAGEQVLRLTLDRKSCICTNIELPPEIPPGKDGKVVFRWVPLVSKSGPYELTATVRTNDPQTELLTLKVTGSFNPLIRVWPEDEGIVEFHQLKQGQPAERVLKVFSTKLDDFSLEASTTNPQQLSVTVSKLPPNATIEPNVFARSGYRVVLRTSDKLTPGYLYETLNLIARVPSEAPRTISLKVYGQVENAILQITPEVITFRGHDPSKGETMKVRLQFFVPSEQQTLQVAKVEPGFLVCSQPRSLKKPGMWEMTVSIPSKHPDLVAHQAYGFFEGRIVLRATHPDVEIPVRVKWSRQE